MEDEMTDETQFPDAELARLADGTLPPGREAELRAEVDRSPELAASLAEQQRAVSLMSTLDERAPDSLRARIEADTAGSRSSRRAPRWRPSLVLPAATALAVVVAALVVLLQGSTGSPTVPQTVRVTLAAATLPAPAQDAARPYALKLGVDGIPFPDWQQSLGWSATGARLDTIGGRHIATVFYTGRGGQRVGYAIVSGAPLPVGAGAASVKRGGETYTLQRHGTSRLVTWVRSGHTCVIAGADVSFPTLLGLATGDTL
jgi:hypothetical protein